MGNCCMRGGSSSMVWAGDDWGSMGRNGHESHDDDKKGPMGGGVGAELRIKISKKQLDQLLNRAEEKVLQRLIEKSVQVQVRRRRPWRPKLQSIPEGFYMS